VSVPTRAGLVAQLVREALTEDQIRDLAFEHFRPVYDEYSAAMSRSELVRRLVAWCDRHDQLMSLARLVAELNPEMAVGIESRLAALPARPAAMAVPPGVGEHRPPFIAHPLPEAPTFVGREAELEALEQFWTNGPNGLFCLVALGGAGKTAITAEFLRRVQADPEHRPGSLLVWSFYETADTQAFLDAARGYFGFDQQSGLAGAAGALYLMIRAMESGHHNLLVLDGLERMQRSTAANGLLGDIVDPTLSQLVRRLAAGGIANTKAIITTRLYLTRVEPWLGRTCFVRDVTAMSPHDAHRLLVDRGVVGDNAALQRLVETYGAHALTLDHLSGYLRTFNQGQAEGAHGLPEPRLDTADMQEYRLARVLTAYASSLNPHELGLLSRLCVFRAGMTTGQLYEIFSQTTESDGRPTPAEGVAGPLRGLDEARYRRIMGRLAQLHLVLDAGQGRWTAHPAVRDYFLRQFADVDAVEDAARRHYARLVGSPGGVFAWSDAALDALEELVYHTLRLGQVDAARDIYANRIGGVQHLGWRLGQYGRCVRMLEEFPRPPDVGDLIWCYRALGDLDAASCLVDPDDVWWLGMIGCLRGRLAEVADLLSGNDDDAILLVCEVLTGQLEPEALYRAPRWPGLPITVAEAWLIVGRPDEATAAVEQLRHEAPGAAEWNDEESRADLVLAEVARRTGDLSRCRALLDKASQWIIASGSQEHLCKLHIGEVRLALDETRLRDAATIIRQGLLAAEHCCFGLLHIDLLIEAARLALAECRFKAAANAALSALNGIGRDQMPRSEPGGDPQDLALLGTLHPLCGYVWGTDRARRLYAAAQSQHTA
jgi:Effector-associated domain 7